MLDTPWSLFVKLITRTRLYKFYNKYFWKPEPGSLEEIIYKFAKTNNPFTIIQIGANDGYHNDPLYRFIRSFDWRGVLVEPQINVFSRLKSNYANVSNLKFENAAISNLKTSIPFFKISFSDARWATGLGSFDKQHIIHHIEKGYVDKWAKREGVQIPAKQEDYITSVEVNTISFDALIVKHNIDRVDGIFMDCEEFDEEVLRSIEIKKYDPRIIFFEHLHFQDKDYAKLVEELKDLGYTVERDTMDTIAYKN